MWWRKPTEEQLEKQVRLKAERDSKIDSYNDLLRELHTDRGMLLGSNNFSDLTGVERTDALMEIDKRIRQIKEAIEWEVEQCQKAIRK